jgi:hypothetical protein
MEGLAMSKQKPDPEKTLYVHTHGAYVLKSSIGRFSKTSLLFSITDYEWRAWYTFSETLLDQKAMRVFDADLTDGPKRHRGAMRDHVQLAGARMPATEFSPTQALRVDQFEGVATLRSPRWSGFSGIVLRMDLDIHLKDGVQRLSLKIRSEKKSQELPASQEPSAVVLLKLERYRKVWHQLRFMDLVLETGWPNPEVARFK